MPTTVTGSSYISVLDSKITASLCDGNFHVDVSPSTFLAGGQAYVEGASVKIENPLGIIIKNYTTSGYDIEPPMTEVVEFAIPLIASNYQYGSYKITVRLTDEDGVDWFIEKTVNICAPDSKNKNKKTACLNATLEGNCVDGKVVVLLSSPPNYKGKTVLSQVNTLTLLYPTVSGVPPLVTSAGAFSVRLYEGEYKISGTVCATYDYGDNVFFAILYDVKCIKNIKCILDECCVYAQLEELNARLKSDCTTKEKEETSGIIFDALRLLKTISLSASCGKDPSDFVAELETLLGCSCTCNCNDGVPIINNDPVTDFTFEGCGFTQETVGLTKVITLNNVEAEVTVSDASGLITISAPEENVDQCKKTQVITVNQASIAQFIAADRGYLLMMGTVSQVGTAAPTFDIWTNDTLRTISASVRSTAGDYLITVTGGLLSAASTAFIIGQDKTSQSSIGRYSDTQFYIQTQTAAAVYADNKLTYNLFEIRIKI